MRLVACGAVMPEVLAAAALLEESGVAAAVIDVTSADRLYRDWQRELREAAAARGADVRRRTVIGRLLGSAGAPAPIVTVHDAASHALAWVGAPSALPPCPSGSTNGASPARSTTSTSTSAGSPSRSPPPPS